MYWNGMPLTLSERLCKLEIELDQLLNIQEKIKYQSKENFPSPVIKHKQQSFGIKTCPCVNITSNTRSCTVVGGRRAIAHCENNATSPFTDITKFLQNINFNLSKGTQAIAKIANSTTQQKLDCAEPDKSQVRNCLKPKEDSNLNEFPNVWKTNSGKSLNEEAFFKELREEKDKRIRAENQAKSLKEELKKAKTEIQEKATTTISLLQAELKETVTQLNEAKNQLEKCRQVHQAAECLWPLKYDAVCQDLNEEKLKRKEAEQNVQRMQGMLQRLHLDTEDHLRLRKNADWLKDQNQNLLCFTTKLKTEIDEKNAEIRKKNQTLFENLEKVKLLTNLCEKLRDHIIIMKDKIVTSDENLRQNLIHSQKLSEKLMEAQSNSEELNKCQIKDRVEHQRLSELVDTVNSTNSDLQIRLTEMSDMMKEQNSLISRQAETINVKEEQLKLAYENIKLQSERLHDLKNQIRLSHNDTENHQLESQMKTLMLELEKEKENVLIKEKIINSHMQTIAQLKNGLTSKEEELKCQRKETFESERKLAMEQTTNEHLLSKIKLLQNHKEELKLKVEELEGELEIQLSSEHTKRLEQIEKQVRAKQKEWEEQKSQLIQDKEEALESLRCTNQKLADNAVSYQVELKKQQCLVDTLNNQLVHREKQLQETEDKMSSLNCELYEVKESAVKMKNSFEEKLKNACEAWQKTMQLLQN